MGMKRTLIALAVSAAFAAPAAYADVTLSGSINAGPAWVKSNDGSSGAINSVRSTVGATTGQVSGQTQDGINTNYTNITIGSMEDLGGGLKLDFAYQITANFQSVTSSPQNRNSHIGLVGDNWGGVWIGTNENLYERYYYTVDPLDGAAGMGGNLQILGSPGYGQVFDAPGGNLRGTADFYRRTDHTVWYDSPNWGGFTFGAYTTLHAYKTGNTGLSNPGVWGVGGKWVGQNIPLQLWAAYERHKDLDGLAQITGATIPGLPSTPPAVFGNVTGSVGQSSVPTSTKDEGGQIGIGWTLGDIFMFANFEQLKYKADGLGQLTDIIEYKRKAWSVGAKWNVATGYFGGQYIKAMNASCQTVAGGCNADHTGADMVGVGYYHTLSKQTQAYIMASWIGNDDLNQYNFAGGVGAVPRLGASIFGATIGLKHSF
jgi:predicted porin